MIVFFFRLAIITDLYNISRDAFEVAWLWFSVHHHLPYQSRPILTASKDIKQAIKFFMYKKVHCCSCIPRRINGNVIHK